MKVLGIALGLVLVLAWPAVAAVIEVPVPELAGTHSCVISSGFDPDSLCHWTVTIHLPVIPAVIRSVALRVNGATTCASFGCDTNPVGAYCPLLLAELAEPGIGHEDWESWHQSVEAGPIAYTQPFESASHGTWAFLLDGTATLSFTIDANPPLDCALVGPRDTTTLDSVTLLVDGDFPTGVARASWGHLKAIYR